MELEYGQWATHKGERYMITDWDDVDVKLFTRQDSFWVKRSELSDISDFKTTPAERAALGYAF